MGGCCSCHKDVSIENYPADLQEHKQRELNDKGIAWKGDDGARILLQGSSKYVSMFSQQGKKGVNQDAMTVWENFSSEKDMFFCGMFDGHGSSGHVVSRYIRDHLPAKISSLHKQASTDVRDDELKLENNSREAKENPRSINPLFMSWEARFTKGFHDTDDELKRENSIDSYTSGATAVCVLRKGEHLIIANLGDSRAILATRTENNHLLPEQLTVDLKPNLPEEAERIQQRGGRVVAMEEEPNVYRVWMPQENCPGLAMSRAFGDFCLKDFGLISTPQVTYKKLTHRDEFVVLATDGIWDALSNKDVVKIVASAMRRRRSMAAKLLVQKAARAWRDKYPRTKVDDCSAVCLFFNRPKPFLSKPMMQKTMQDNKQGGFPENHDDIIV